jgi:hypothetical protein
MILAVAAVCVASDIEEAVAIVGAREQALIVPTKDAIPVPHHDVVDPIRHRRR